MLLRGNKNTTILQKILIPNDNRIICKLSVAENNTKCYNNP